MARLTTLALLALGADARLNSGAAGNTTEKAAAGSTNGAGALKGTFVLHKRYALDEPTEEFDVVEIPDASLTQSCSNYVDDNSTVFSRDGKLVLKVASHCEGGGCLNSGRVMSKDSFKYGLFTFSAKVPKCNYIWPAIWLLPNNTHGEGTYGRWPCSGEIDVLETVHDGACGAFNLVAGYGSAGGCGAEMMCNKCVPGYCTSTTMGQSHNNADLYYIEDADCNAEHPTWEEHRFVLNWQPDELTTWVDPYLTWDEEGHLVGVTPKASPPTAGFPTWRIATSAPLERTYKRETTPTWKAVGDFMQTCFEEKPAPDAPFDDRFKIVLNIAVGGYGGAPCRWGSNECQTTCGKAVGSEMIMADISVWELADKGKA